MEDNNNIVEETRLKVNKIEKYKEEANNCKKQISQWHYVQGLQQSQPFVLLKDA